MCFRYVEYMLCFVFTFSLYPYLHAGCQNGGTELLVLRLGDCSNGDFFSSTLKQTGLENENDPNANTYSIIGNLDKDDFVNPDGTYEFRLWYDNRYDHIGESNLRWKQSSWLTDTFSSTGALNYAPGFEEISFVPAEWAGGDDAFYGLGLSEYPHCYLDGTSAGPDYFNCVGAILGWGGNFIAGYNRGYEIAQELYICKPGMTIINLKLNSLSI